MKRLFKLKYPKTILLILCIFAAYIIFSNSAITEIISHSGSFGYLGSFIAGLFFSFGFTTPFSIGYFLQLNPENILVNALIGGFGAMISDLFIFSVIRFSFLDEFNKLEKTKPIKYISNLIDKSFGHKIKSYLLYIFAGIIIASPLPDEVGVTMLAGLSKIKPISLGILSFIFNSLGILIILLI